MSQKPLSMYFVVLLSLAFLAGADAFVPNRFGVIGTSTSFNGASVGLAPPMSPTIIQSSLLVSGQEESERSRALRYEQERQDWIERSVTYYTKVMRGQVKDFQQEDLLLAKKHYFAIRKVKDGKLHQAELIYRRIIDELMADEEQCDHAKLAATTLLLALLTKRMGDPKKTRSVFLHFFKLAVFDKEEDAECACSAKVLLAFALFEMQQGNKLKSVDIAQRALQFDSTLAPVLKWKQFRDALRRRGEDAVLA